MDTTHEGCLSSCDCLRLQGATGLAGQGFGKVAQCSSAKLLKGLALHIAEHKRIHGPETRQKH